MKRFLSLVAASAVAVALIGSSPLVAQTNSPGIISAERAGTFYTHDNAELLYRQAKYTQAEAMCKAAIADIEKNKGDKAPGLAEPLIDLATIYMRQAKFAEAKTAIDRADGLLDKTKPDQALIFGRLGINKGWRLYILGETAASAKVCQESIDVLKNNNVKESKDLAELINNLGLMDEELADKTEDRKLDDAARLLLIQGWQMRRKLTGDESPETGESLNNLGMHFLFNARSADEAETAFKTLKESLAVAKKVYGDNHPETAVSHATLALALYMDGQLEESEKEIKLAMPITEKFLGADHPDMAYELSTLARIQMEQSKFSEAEKMLDQVVKINEKVYGKTSPQIVPSLEAMKRFYDQRGDAGKSRDLEKRVENIKGKDI